MENWVIVLDEEDALSQEQLKVCKVLKPEVKGVVMCPRHASPELCDHVDFFPAFCHTKSNSCVYGMRTTKEDFADLATTVPPPRIPSQSESRTE